MSEAELGDCRWWQRHRWTKWYEIDVVRYVRGQTFEGLGQERRCLRCGYRQKQI